MAISRDLTVLQQDRGCADSSSKLAICLLVDYPKSWKSPLKCRHSHSVKYNPTKVIYKNQKYGLKTVMGANLTTELDWLHDQVYWEHRTGSLWQTKNGHKGRAFYTFIYTLPMFWICQYFLTQYCIIFLYWVFSKYMSHLYFTHCIILLRHMKQIFLRY